MRQAKYKAWFQSIVAVYNVALNWSLNKALLEHIVSGKAYAAADASDLEDEDEEKHRNDDEEAGSSGVCH